jgi:hypothetical protein
MSFWFLIRSAGWKGLRKGIFQMSDEDDVRAIITPTREAKIYRAFHAAWDDYIQDRSRYKIWPRTRANMVFERIAVRLQEQFLDDPGMYFDFANETVKITIDQKLLARCKKANSKGLGQNIPTQANDLFCEQDMFAAVAPLDKIEIVYVVNMLSTEIRRILIQARDGDVRLWSYEIDDTALASVAPVISIPTPATPPALVPDASDLVNPRTKPASKDEEKDGK